MGPPLHTVLFSLGVCPTDFNCLNSNIFLLSSADCFTLLGPFPLLGVFFLQPYPYCAWTSAHCTIIQKRPQAESWGDHGAHLMCIPFLRNQSFTHGLMLEKVALCIFPTLMMASLVPVILSYPEV